MALETVIDRYSDPVARRLVELRSIILGVAKSDERIGTILECLKWGQPSFVTENPRSGSTIRIDAIRDTPDKVAMYFVCSTTLLDQFRERYPDTFEFSGNRALVFDLDTELPREPLDHCIAMALTYHLKN